MSDFGLLKRIDVKTKSQQHRVIRIAVNKLFLATVTLGCSLALARADTVHFDDALRPATDSLSDGPVTVSASAESAPQDVTTGAGSGLGVLGIGAGDSVDLVLHYAVGQQYADNGFGFGVCEFLNLASDCDFESITLVPHFPVVQQTGQPVDAQFAWFGLSLGWPGFGMATPRFYPSNAAPVTIQITPTMYQAPLTSLNLHPDFEGNAAYPQEAQTLSDYRLQHLNEEQTIVLGFSVLSVDVVPEPSAAALGLVGVSIVFAQFRVRRNRNF